MTKPKTAAPKKKPAPEAPAAPEVEEVEEEDERILSDDDLTMMELLEMRTRIKRQRDAGIHDKQEGAALAELYERLTDEIAIYAKPLGRHYEARMESRRALAKAGGKRRR